ncbi:MAG: hypothetical protein ABSC37_06455, partial [Xanthobacteraceae bacterium]
NTGHAVSDFLNDFPQGMPVALYVAKRSYVSANLQAVQGFRAALGEAIEFMNSKPEQTRAYALKYLNMPPQVLAAMKMPDLRVKIDPERVDDWVKIMMSQNLVKGPIDLKQLLLQ